MPPARPFVPERAAIYSAAVALAGLFTLPFLIPLHTQPITSFYKEWWAAACGLGLIASWLFAKTHTPTYLPRITWGLLVLCVLIAVQMALGMLAYPGQGGLVLLCLIWAMLLMSATRATADRISQSRLIDILAGSVLVAGIVNAIAGLLQAYGLSPGYLAILLTPGDPRHVYGNIAQSNHYANYLSLALASAMYLAYQGRLPRLAIFPSFILLITGLAVSGSRSVWLYLIAITLLAAIPVVRRTSDIRKRLLWGMAGVVLAFQISQTILAHQGTSQTINSRIQAEMANEWQVGKNEAATLPVRLALWRDALMMFSASPWLGVGHNNYAWHHFELIRTGESLFTGQRDHERIYWSHAHNIVLHLLAEFGIIAIGLTLYTLYLVMQIILRIKSPQDWWIASGLTIIVIHSLLEYPLWHINFLGVFVVLFSLADHKPVLLDIPGSSRRRLGFFIMLIGAGVLTLQYFSYTALERALAYANSQAVHTREFQKSLHLAQTNPFLEPQVDSLISQLPATGPLQHHFIMVQLQLNNRLVRHRADADTIYQRTTLLWMAGKTEEAARWLDMATHTYPGYYSQYLRRTVSTFGSNQETAPLIELIRNSAPAFK